MTTEAKTALLELLVNFSRPPALFGAGDWFKEQAARMTSLAERDKQLLTASMNTASSATGGGTLGILARIIIFGHNAAL